MDNLFYEVLDLLTTYDFKSIESNWFQDYQADFLQAIENWKHREDQNQAESYVDMCLRELKFTPEDAISIVKSAYSKKLNCQGLYCYNNNTHDFRYNT